VRRSGGTGWLPGWQGDSVAVGTKAGLVDEPQPQSVFKHAVLESYVPRFVSMTGSASRNRRVVVVDGFAGRGRYTGGSPASAERLLQAARDAPGAGVELVLVERDQRLYADLSQVATEYEQQGVQVITRLGDVQDHLAEVVERAAGVPLFLFLDPCGAQLPYTRLVSLLAKERPAAKWPPTEVLLNFSADLTRRAGGQLRSGVPGDGVARLDAVCGSAWVARKCTGGV